MTQHTHISNKLSVGICSTALSMFVLGMPGLVHADEARPAPATPSENNQLTVLQEQKAITPAATEAPVENNTEQTMTNSEETNVSELPKETVAIITEQPVEVPATPADTKPASAELVTPEPRDTTAVPEDGLTGDERAAISERATYKPLTQEYA